MTLYDFLTKFMPLFPSVVGVPTGLIILWLEKRDRERKSKKSFH